MSEASVCLLGSGLAVDPSPLFFIYTLCRMLLLFGDPDLNYVETVNVEGSARITGLMPGLFWVSF